MPDINGNITLIYNAYGDPAHCFISKDYNWDMLAHTSADAKLSIEQGKFIQDGDTISIPVNYDKAINYNYLVASIVLGGSDGTIPAYFFIDGYQYKNSETTDIHITLDTMQTFKDQIGSLQGHLNRSHAPSLISRTDGDGHTHTIINPDLYFSEDDECGAYRTIGAKGLRRNKDPWLCVVFRDPIKIDYPGVGYGKWKLYKPSNVITWLDDDFQWAHPSTIYCPVARSPIASPYAPSLCLSPQLSIEFEDYPKLTTPKVTGCKGMILARRDVNVNGDQWSYVAPGAASSNITLGDYDTPYGTATEDANAKGYPMAFNSLLIYPTDIENISTKRPHIKPLKVGRDTSYYCLLYRPKAHSGVASFQHDDTSALNELLGYGTLLQDRIVCAFEIPFTVDPLRDNYDSDFNKAFVPVNILNPFFCKYTSQEDFYDSISTADYALLNEKDEAFIITDIRALSLVIGEDYGAVSKVTKPKELNFSAGDWQDLDQFIYNQPLVKKAVCTLTDNIKLNLYPYKYMELECMNAIKKISYQDYAPLYWQIDPTDFSLDNFRDYLYPFIVINPLSATPQFFMDTVCNPTTIGYGTKDSTAIDTSCFVGRSHNGYGVYMNEGIDANTIYCQLPEASSYLPSYAIYQKSYDAYVAYQKAMVDSQTSYQTTMARVSGISNLVGGVANITAGTFLMHTGIEGANNTDLTPNDITFRGMHGRWRDARSGKFIRRPSFTPFGSDAFSDDDYTWQSDIGKGIAGFGAGLSQMISGASTLTNTPAYLRSQQLMRENVARMKSSTQTGGAYKGELYYVSLNGLEFVYRIREMPKDLLAGYAKKFYWLGYYIPVDVNLEFNTTSFSVWIATKKKILFYMQFDSVRLNGSGFSADAYPPNIPLPYLQDMERRLCQGVTFINADNITNSSTPSINGFILGFKDEDNSDLETPEEPLFNKGWTPIATTSLSSQSLKEDKK